MVWVTIPDEEIEPESPVTSILFHKNRDNLAAVAAGLAGAPKILTAAYNALSVNAAALAANAVTTVKINALAVTNVKLAANAVETAKILNLNVTQGKMANNSVNVAKLAITSGSVALTTATPTLFTLPGGWMSHHISQGSTGGGGYSFTRVCGAGAAIANQNPVSPSARTAYVFIQNDQGGISTTVYSEYHSATSEDLWVFSLYTKQGLLVGQYEAPDHPCYGNGMRPEITPHPFPSYDPKEHDIVVGHITDHEMIEDIRMGQLPVVGGGYLSKASMKKAGGYEIDGTRPERSMLDSLNEYCTMDHQKGIWPDHPINLGVATIWKGQLVRYSPGRSLDAKYPVIFRPIKKPDYLQVVNYKAKK